MKDRVFVVFFDAKMKTYTDRKNYQTFSRALKGEGFLMLQKSVYMRYVRGNRTLKAEADRIKKITPSTIQVCLFSITAEVFTSMVWLNCPLPEIVDRRDIICI